MKILFNNANVFIDGAFKHQSVLVENGRIVNFFKPSISCEADKVIDLKNKYIFPGFVDVHVHLREPGFFYKETVKTGTLAGASQGYTSLFAMANLNPVPDSLENLQKELDIIQKDAVINVYPYASITKGEKGKELVDFESLKDKVLAFSDDGKGVQTREMMLLAMQKVKKLNKIIVAHAEDESLLNGGYIHDGEYAKQNGHQGICSASEYKQVERDLELAKQTGVKYHVCHVSAKETVALIRQAKKDGVDVTCETAPHYLVLTDCDLKEDGRYKMNPPLRSKQDKLALIEGVLDGTIDMIATDHAPHSKEEKSKGLKGSLMGITGLECAFPILYTKLVKTGVISLEKLVELMSKNPAKRFNLESEIKIGTDCFNVYDLDCAYQINSEKFISMGKITPFDKEKVYAKCIYTVCNGKTVWNEIY